MTTLETQISEFETRKSQLYNRRLQNTGAIDTFVANLAAYIRTAGVNSQNQANPNSPQYQAANTAWGNVATLLKDNQTLSSDMARVLKDNTATDVSLQVNLQRLGAKQQELSTAKRNLQLSESDLEVAKSRQQNVSTASTNQSYFQGFSGTIGFTRPLKKSSIPLLLGLGFFIFFATALILKDFFTTSAEVASQYVSLSEIVSYISSKNSRVVLIGVIGTFIAYAIGLYVYFYVWNK